MDILVIEDDPVAGRILQLALNAEGHTVDLASSGQEGLARAVSRPYELVLLNLLIRDVQGLQLLERLRQEGVSTPIIAVGGGASAGHLMRALDAGADEYVTQPLIPDELAARVRALMSRAAALPAAVLGVENLTLNLITHQAFVDGVQLRLTPKEFSLLHQFLQRQREPLTRTQLLETVWEMHVDPGSNVVDVHLSRLRSKLQQAGANVVIEAIRGAGFVLTAGRGPAPRAGKANVVA